MDLFDAPRNKHEEPLAARMRPRNLDEYIGQDHIVGKGRLLRRAIAADQLTSVIFYGPPGTGKTTLAKVIANHTKSNFLTLNAVLTGVQNIRDAIKNADDQKRLYNRRTILFVDEVHRWNKSQQDALLPWVENGTIILVGATTENPFFEVNKALVSRSRVFQLKPLTKDDLTKAAEMALKDKERGYGRWKVTFEPGALEHLIDTANGDARSLLNALELAVETTPEKWAPDETPCVPPENTEIYITKETAEESIQKKVVLYDRDGDYHYDIISAFIKSLRGRDPDAALYWMARMISAGEDPNFIFRRMLISACEDTGLADPYALGVVQSCAAAFDRIGLPEGQYMLTQAALYLATAPKSNSAMAYFDAMKAVQSEDAEVPNHLRDNSRDAEGFGHGAGYLYPHAYRDHWVAQQYLPDSLNGRVFYNPQDQGYEKTIKDDVLSRREIQIAALLEETLGTAVLADGAVVDGAAGVNVATNPIGDWWEAEHLKNGSVKTGENLTFSPGQKQRDAWQKRTESGRPEFLLALRNKAVQNAALNRHHCCLVFGADDGLLLWEIWRRTPEGCTAGLCRTKRGYEVLEQYGKNLGELEKPILAVAPDVKCTVVPESKDANSADATSKPTGKTDTTRTSGIAANITATFAPDSLKAQFPDIVFDRFFMRDAFVKKQEIEPFAEKLSVLLADASISAKDCFCILLQKLPCKSQRLSQLFMPLNITAEQRTLFLKMNEAEDVFYSGKTAPDSVKDIFSWGTDDVKAALEKAGLCFTIEEADLTEKRSLSDDDIDRWFNTSSSYGKTIRESMADDDFKKAVETMRILSKNRTFQWRQTTLILQIKHKQDI
ncbi:MAG: AAA family ATPase [Treponemataceae bacterium]|nr:AAA family ATPase [Treponemataceae bacterium]